MDITVNQQNYSATDYCSLHLLLAELNIPLTGMAVAVNQSIVRKADWENFQLSPGDNIMLIKATQGG